MTEAELKEIERHATQWKNTLALQRMTHNMMLETIEKLLAEVERQNERVKQTEKLYTDLVEDKTGVIGIKHSVDKELEMDKKELDEIKMQLNAHEGSLSDLVPIGWTLLAEVKRLRSIEIMWHDSERILRKKLQDDYGEIQHKAYHALFDEEKPATCIVCNPQGGQNELKNLRDKRPDPADNENTRSMPH